MIWLWRFISGFLEIEITGENCEQILNRAATNNIYFWNLKFIKGKIYGCISIKNFLKLFTNRHGLKCKIKIIKKIGIIFHIKKYKKRFGFFIGGIIFTFIIFFLSNFIWVINVEGNNIIPTQEILNSCRIIGIYEGIAKNKVNNKYDAQRLQLTRNDIAWCSFNVEGCVLTVNLSEIEKSEGNYRQDPTNIKAAIEGKIKKINVTSGNIMVKVGDTVSKGDILVSGIVENMSSTVFVHSSGEIIAETKRIFSARGDFIQEKNLEIGDRLTRYSIKFFNVKIPLYLGKINENYNYTCTIKNLSLFGSKIPIKIAQEQYIFQKKAKVKYNRSELEEILHNDIKNQLKNFNFITASQVDKEIIYTDSGMLLKITYACEEDIAVQNKILFSKEN